MTNICTYMHTDHKRCDDLFAQAEINVDKADWDQAVHAFKCFHEALEQHFSMEEEVLFPAFEQVVGHSAGPTQIMRIEHQQIRGLISMMFAAIFERRRTDFLGYSDTLNIMLHQHNLKEEGIFYPMCDRALHVNWHEVIRAMDKISMIA